MSNTLQFPTPVETAGDSIESIYKQACLHIHGTVEERDLSKALKLFRDTAALGHVLSMCNIAFILLSGESTVEDYAESHRWLELALEKGSGEAAFNLGHLYASGMGVETNFQKAASYYEIALNHGIADATYNLALFHFEGTLGEADKTKAIELFKLGSDAGQKDCQFSLAHCYGRGDGVEKDMVESIMYYQLAASNGHVNAQYNLGLYFFYGEGGLVENRVAAKELFEKAAALGHEQAKQALAAPEMQAV